MDISISENELADYVSRQCNYFFPDEETVKIGGVLRSSLDLALERTEYCFSRIRIKGYGEGKTAYFNHLHSDQYLTFLYYLSNSIWKLQPEYENVCRKLIMLNKALNSCWFSYKGNLPKVFYIGHPVGTVLGNACYGEFAVFMQNCTVTTPIEKKNQMGDYLFMSAGSKIIGDEKIGNDVTLGVDTTVYRREVKDKTLIYRDEHTGKTIERYNYISPARHYFYVD